MELVESFLVLQNKVVLAVLASWHLRVVFAHRTVPRTAVDHVVHGKHPVAFVLAVQYLRGAKRRLWADACRIRLELLANVFRK